MIMTGKEGKIDNSWSKLENETEKIMLRARLIILSTSFLILGLGDAFANESSKNAARSRIRNTTLVREVSLVRKGKTAAPVKRRFDAVVLENKYIALTLCPALGERIMRVVDKLTGRQLLYEGRLLYSGSALTEGGGSGGGIQINHPYYHAGSSYVVPLPYTTAVQEDGTAVLTLAYTSYPHLQRTIWRISLRPAEAAFRSDYQFENLSPYSMGFNPWINAAYPLRKDVQFILPVDWVAGHWFGINQEERWGNWLRPWPIDKDGNDQSYIVNGKEPSVFGYGLSEGYSAIYFHDSDDGLVRVFDPVQMPGAKAAGKWRPKAQGWVWCEVWGAFSHNMEDPLWAGPHETVRSSDMWFPIHGIRGMSWASEKGALNLRKDGAKLTCGVYFPRDYGRGALRVAADGNLLIQKSLELRPEKPFVQTVACPADTDEVRVTVVDASGRTILTHQKFFAKRPRKIYKLPEKPWHRQTAVSKALWEEAFTPMMAWGPWYHPPTSYAKVIESEPANVEALIGRARSLIKEANADLFRARKAPPAEERQEAAAILAKLAAAKKADPRAILLLGLVQMQQGEKKAAAVTLSRLVGTPNDCEMVHYQLGLLAAAAGDWKKTLKESQHALELAPDSTLSRLLVAIARLRTGHPDTVGEILAPVLEANPLEVGALVLASRAAKTLGKPDDVKRLAASLARIKKLAPGQYRAGLAQVASLEKGEDLDCQTIDTIRGSPDLPGRPP